VRKITLSAFALFGATAIASMPLEGCSGKEETTGVATTESGGAGANTNVGGSGAGTSTGGSPNGGAGPGGSGVGAGVPPPPTEQVKCGGNKLYECGDLIDNDDDGLIDYQDPDCLGPCDNNESGFYPGLPGAPGQKCDLDCFWDTGQGHEENCYWDHHCDPYSDLATYPEANPQSSCSWNSDTQGPVNNQSFPPSPYNCDQMFNEQPQQCLDTCLVVAPNGCDCFGCCELGGEYVWVGSLDPTNKFGTCDLAAVGAPDFHEKCHPCTPVPGCNNPCGHCELCIGKTELPPDCYENEGGGGGSPQDCPAGQEACGLPNQPPCPSGKYCITGCCVLVPD
jgi:hypothetical protein